MTKRTILILFSVIMPAISSQLDTSTCKRCNPCQDSIVESLKFENPMALSDEEREYIKARKNQCRNFQNDTSKSPMNFIGHRSKQSITDTVKKYFPELQEEFRKRLKSKPDLQGKIIIKIKLDGYGSVVWCDAVKDSIGDDYFKTMIIRNIKTWQFENINKPNDTSSIVYPFVFSHPDYSDLNKTEVARGLLIILNVLLAVLSIALVSQKNW